MSRCRSPRRTAVFADGLVVMTYVQGGPPETEADWRRVAEVLRRLHASTGMRRMSTYLISTLVLPHNAAALDDDTYDVAAQASAAWEAAVCWKDDYAVRRLAEVRPG